MTALAQGTLPHFATGVDPKSTQLEKGVEASLDAYRAVCLDTAELFREVKEVDSKFPDKPPIYLRAQFYDYTYASSSEHAAGRWWDRRLLGLYFPAAHLKGQ